MYVVFTFPCSRNNDQENIRPLQCVVFPVPSRRTNNNGDIFTMITSPDLEAGVKGQI